MDFAAIIPLMAILALVIAMPIATLYMYRRGNIPAATVMIFALLTAILGGIGFVISLIVTAILAIRGNAYTGSLVLAGSIVGMVLIMVIAFLICGSIALDTTAWQELFDQLKDAMDETKAVL